MTSIDTCQILLERYVLSSNMTYLQVLFESYLCYAVSSACNIHPPSPPFLFWQNLLTLKPPFKFFLFRKPLAPDPQ